MASILQAVVFLLLLRDALPQAPGEQKCDTRWHVHTQTDTCIRVFDDEKAFDEAMDACQQQESWLVIIHTANTNAFVQSLLDSQQKAYIGLQMNTKSERFYWLENAIDLVGSYFDWMPGEPRQNCAYITKAGWGTVSIETKYGYVCQKSTLFPSPAMNCEPVQLGAPFPSLTCSIAVLQTFGGFSRFKASNSKHMRLVECFSNSECDTFNDDISGAIQVDSSSITSLLSINRNATWGDDRMKWTCAFDFTNIRRGTMTSSCTMTVYVPPSSLKCGYTLTDKLFILCEVDGVYPHPASELIHYVGGIEKEEWDFDNIDNGQSDYRSKLSRRITGEIQEGNHSIEVLVFPNVFFASEEKKRKASLSRTLHFLILVPTEPPVISTGKDLSIQQGKLKVEEGKHVVLVCRVSGGEPPVFETEILCDPGVEDSQGMRTWSSSDGEIRTDFVSSRKMNRKNCTCSAKHVSKLYTKQSSVELNVLYSTQSISFTVNGNHDEEIELREGETVDFKCSADGSPAPDIRIAQTFNSGKSSRSLIAKANAEEISIKVKATCNMSGIYICSARDPRSAKVFSHEIHLMVQCRPQYCSQRDYDREFSVRPGQDVELEICVYAYPPIKRLEVAKTALLKRETYEASFKYTDSDEAIGLVSIRISASQTELGNYSVITDQTNDVRSNIRFSLVPLQTPSCPTSFETSLIGSNYVSLSWEPAFDRGLLQTFIVSVIQNGVQDIHIDDVPDNGNSLMQYNATDLDSSSGYTFKIDVRNDIGVTECPQLMLDVTTHGSINKSREKDIGLLAAIIIIIIIAVLVVIVLLAIVITRRKRQAKICQSKYDRIYSNDGVSEPSGQRQGQFSGTSSTFGDRHMADTRSTLEDHNPGLHSTNKAQIEGDAYATIGATASKKVVKGKANERAPDGDFSTETLNGKAKQREEGKRDASTDRALVAPPNAGVEVGNQQPAKELVYLEVEVLPRSEGVQMSREPKEESVTYASVKFS